MSYMPYGSEVDVSFINEHFDVFLPRITDDDQMEAYKDDRMHYLINSFGIPEPDPAYTEKTDPHDLDVIIVPVIAFDDKCNRLGHGKAYYDRFLKDLKALKIGVAFEIQKTDHISCDPHDIRMDMIISDKKIYR